MQCTNSVEDKPNELSNEIVCHISHLKTKLMHDFPDDGSCAYSTNPFFIDPADLPVGTREQEELTDIQTDKTAKIKHKLSYKVLVKHGIIVPSLACHAVP